jgi:hypothetical protein
MRCFKFVRFRVFVFRLNAARIDYLVPAFGTRWFAIVGFGFIVPSLADAVLRYNAKPNPIVRVAVSAPYSIVNPDAHGGFPFAVCR